MKATRAVAAIALAASRSPALATLPGGDGLVAWQGHARGPRDVVVARVPGAAGATAPRRAIRVDGSATSGTSRWLPQVAVTARRAAVAGEDGRDGPAPISIAPATPARVG